jgi:hypothetical protein
VGLGAFTATHMNHSHAKPGGSSTRGILRNEVLAGALVCLLFALAFARTPIARLSDGTWSPADTSQVMSLTRVAEPIRPGNELLSDVWLQMHSWLQFQRDELRAFRMPLWNPWNGNGVPQLANYQSAVLSPFSLPYYALPFALAVVLASVAKLFCLSFFTFLFLRELRLAFSASMLGALVFAYAGHNVVLIGHPHSSVAALMPAALFLVERIVRRSTTDDALEPGWRAVAPGLLAWLVAVLVLLQFAGHPETLFFALFFVGIYAAVRLCAAWRDARGADAARRRVRVIAVQLVACALLAAAIGSLQTLPFFEYLRSSAMLGSRTGRQIPLGLRMWSTLLYPDLLGNPSDPYYVMPTLPKPDFTIAMMAYVGGTATLAALSAFLFAAKRRAVAFFAGAFVLWFVYAYDVAGTGVLWDKIPILSLAPINRSQIVGAFCIACLAAFGAHFALQSGRRLAVAAIVIVVGVAGLLLARANAENVVELVRRFLPDEGMRALLVSGSAAHLSHMTWLLAAGIGVLALVWVVPRGWMRTAAVWALALLAYAQTGALLKGYMPVCDDQHFFPVTPAIEAWKTAAGDREVLVLGDDSLPPSSNIVYGLRQAASYDALGIRRYERLYQEHFGPQNNWMLATRASTRGLRLFGLEAVLDHDGWLEVDTAFGAVEPDAKSVARAGELVRGTVVVQELTGIRDGLDSIRLRFDRPADELACSVDVALEDDSGTAIASKRTTAATMDDSARDEVAVTLRFAPIADSRTKRMRLRVSSPDAEPGRAFVPRARSDWDTQVRRAVATIGGGRDAESLASVWKLTRDGQRLPGQLWLDLGYADHEFHAEAPVGRFTLFGLDRATGRFHTVGSARWADGEEESWALVRAPDFDPAREVVIEREPGIDPVQLDGPAAEPRALKVFTDEPGHTMLIVGPGAPAWLVLTQPWYPGWHARVKGVVQPIRRANHAFGAIELPAGRCRVELDYDPPAFKLAGWLALAGILVTSGWVLASRSAQRPTAPTSARVRS